MEWAGKVLALSIYQGVNIYVDSVLKVKTEKQDTTEITTGDSYNAIHEDHFH